MAEGFEEGKYDRSNPVHRAANELGVFISMSSLLGKDDSEDQKVRSFIAKSLGFNQALTAMSDAQNSAIQAAYEAALMKAIKASSDTSVYYRTAEQVADAMIRAVKINMEKSKGGRDGL